MEKKHSEHIKTPSDPAGNTNIVTAGIRKRLFHLTLYGKTQNLTEFLLEKINSSKNLEVVAFQSEICHSTKREHIQCLVYYKNARRMGIELINEWKPHHIEPARENLRTGLNYVLKKDTHDNRVRVHWTKKTGFIKKHINYEGEPEPILFVGTGSSIKPTEAGIAYLTSEFEKWLKKNATNE